MFIRYMMILVGYPTNILIGGLTMTAIKDYTVHIDNKKRITLRGALYNYYNVKEYDNGCIILEPRELTIPEGISSRSLEDMDKAIKNFNLGNISEPIDL